jgi:hypothetical protein
MTGVPNPDICTSQDVFAEAKGSPLARTSQGFEDVVECLALACFDSIPCKKVISVMFSEMKKGLRPLDMSVLEEEQANLQTCRVGNKVLPAS